MEEKYCLYYRGRVERSMCWFLTAVVRGTEYICFDRAIDKACHAVASANVDLSDRKQVGKVAKAEESVFEFFVPISYEKVFCQVMEYLKKEKVVLEYHQAENRLMHEEF